MGAGGRINMGITVAQKTGLEAGVKEQKVEVSDFNAGGTLNTWRPQTRLTGPQTSGKKPGGSFAGRNCKTISA